MSGRRLGLRLPLWSVAAILATRASPGLASPAPPANCPTQHTDTAAVSGRWAPPLDRIVTAHGTDLSLRDALDRVAAAARLRMSYSADLLPMTRAVCLSAVKEPVGQVLAALLDGTNVGAVGLGGDQVVLAPRRDTTGPPADPQMSTSLGVLDRVVVTGSATSNGVPERELSIGLNVLDGRQLSRDNTSTLAGALDDYVPGVWAWAQSPSTMVSSFASIRGASSFGLSYPKVYIDGIEVANPLLLTRFNPGSIDRIEVIRGPQGSALYGTDAISGVVNIVTRHEGAPGDRPALSVRSTFGVAQSSVITPTITPTNVLTQNHSLSIATGTSAKSADFHVSAGSMGSFIPNGYSRDLMATAGARVVGTLSSLNGTARLFVENAGRPSALVGSAPDQMAGDTANPQSVAEYTLGVTGTTLVDKNWTMSLVAGVDGYRLKNVQASSFTPVQSLLDSALHAAEGGADRATMRASSVYQLAPSAPTHATFTFSLEHATLRVASLAPPIQTLETESESGRGSNSGSGSGSGGNGSSGGNGNSSGGSSGPGGPGVIGPVPATSTSTQRIVSWQNSTGLVAQSNVALRNALFLTGGVRFEHDSRLAGVDQIEALPMLGVSVVGEHGPISVKFRTAYGEGIRPPTTPSRLQFWETHDVRIITQTALGPERQSGIESGIDLFFRHTLGLQATHFNQRASGLIELVGVPADTNRHSRHLIPVAENVGEISNHGWELQATGNYRALSLNGTMSFVDSRVQKLATGYTGDLITGDRMLQVPARTQSLGASWNATRWRATIGASRALDWIYYDQTRLAQASVDTPAIDLTGVRLRQFWKHYDGGTRLRASASRDFREMFTFEISGENLLNHQTGEPDDATIIPGRTIMTGVSVKF